MCRAQLEEVQPLRWYSLKDFPCLTHNFLYHSVWSVCVIYVSKWNLRDRVSTKRVEFSSSFIRKRALLMWVFIYLWTILSVVHKDKLIRVSCSWKQDPTLPSPCPTLHSRGPHLGWHHRTSSAAQSDVRRSSAPDRRTLTWSENHSTCPFSILSITETGIHLDHLDWIKLRNSQ